MKKLLAVLLALAMTLGCLPAFAEAAETEDASALPAIGDVVEGFEVKEIRRFDVIGSDLVLFEHQKTGAKLLYIANDDTNRAFQLTFITRAPNDEGMPHVFEHATLSGSDKYPSTTLWANAAYRTYNTYMNAHTMDAMTCFPVASLSEEQLLKLADYYTDECLHPMIMTDESIYRTEAWRYEMTDMDAELTYNGTVYSEMLGAWTLDRSALMNANKVTFPGAAISNDYGGYPDAIPDMTWDELKEFHNKYYHPSNCMVYLYGSFSDYTAFLKLLDEAFAPFEKTEISFEEPDYIRITEPAVSTVTYPVAEGSDTANQSVIYYYILCPGMKGDVEQEQLIDHVCSLLDDEGSPLMQALRQAFPTGSFGVGREVAAPDDAIVFTAEGVNEGDAELFRETITAALADVAKDGFDPALVDNIVTALKFDARLGNEQSSPIKSIVLNLAYDYAVTGNAFRYVDDYEALSRIEAENNEGLLAGAAARWLAEPALWTLTTTVPEPGGQEAHDAALAAKLAEIKAGMSEEEKQAIIDTTNAVPEETDNTELLGKLSAVTVATLPEEVKEYEIRDNTEESGIRRIETVAGVDGVSYVGLYLDAAALPQEDLHYMRLFTRLLGKMDTDQHSWQELGTLIPRYLYNSTFGVAVNMWKNSYHPYVVAEWYALDEDLEADYALAEEVLFHTQFTDTKTLQERIQAQKNTVRSQINSSPTSVMLYRQLGINDQGDAYYVYLNYLEYYSFLEEIEQKMAENPEEVTAGLERVQQFFANRSGAAVLVAGSEESLAANRPLTDSFFAKLDDTAREPAAYSFPVPAAKEGLIFDGNIQFNVIAVPWNTIDPEADGAAYQALGDLVGDMILWGVMRDQMGAYGAYCISSDDELYIYTYRDPNLAETFAFLDTLPDLVAALEVTQEDVDDYIISSYAGLAKPAGELSGAIAAAENRLKGAPDDIRLQNMRTLKTATTETLKTFAGYLADLMNSGIRGTAGSAAAITANADMFDAILNPFNTQDLSAAEFDDLPEGDERSEYAKAAINEGYMIPLSETHFGLDDEATNGDLLGAVFILVGGANRDPDACKELLVEYQLVSEDLDLDAPLTEGFLCDLFAMLGAEGVTTDTPDLVMTRGDLAAFLMAE